MDIRTIFRANLRSLGELTGNQDLDGVWAPEDLSDAEVDGCVHSQFREKAAEYVRAYQSADHLRHFEILLRSAFARSGFTRFDEPLEILDICSGAGNSVIPLLGIFPKAEVIASDLSIQLLAMLKQLLASQGTAHRATLIQMNAERIDFRDSTVDLVVGVASLHHLFRPDLTIAACGRILREGGLAVFFEPFEVGVVFMTMLYRQIVDDPRADTIEPQILHFFKDLIMDVERRLGEDKSDPVFQRLDDKWLFTTHYFREHALRNGFKTCTTYSLLSGLGDCAEKMKVMMKAIERPPEALPDWVWEKVRAHDRCLSQSGHMDCIYEGAILLQK